MTAEAYPEPLTPLARDEVDARHAFEQARRQVLLSGKCPKVSRNGWTVGEQTAWVERQVEDLKFAADKATAVGRRRRIGSGRCLPKRRSADLFSASVRASYEMAGVSR